MRQKVKRKSKLVKKTADKCFVRIEWKVLDED